MKRRLGLKNLIFDTKLVVGMKSVSLHDCQLSLKFTYGYQLNW